MKIKGLIFDVDGTIADTEEIHRQAFNQTFQEFNLSWYWSVEDYHDLLSISGGKERFKKCLNEDIELKNKIENPGIFIQELHRRKSENYRSMLASDDIQLRPGIIRLINEARDKGIQLGIATSSSTANLNTLINKTLDLEPEEIFSAIVSGDIVTDKKPSPVVYQCALAELGLSADVCIAIEDTSNGNQAALNSGLCTIITTHTYTRHDNFDGASLVLDNLGEPDHAFNLTQGYAYGKDLVDIELLDNILTQKEDIEPFEDKMVNAASGIN